MKLEDLLYSGLFFVVVIFSGVTFYVNMLSDHDQDPFNATDSLNSSGELERWEYRELSEQLGNTTEAARTDTQTNESGLLGFVRQVPVIGSITIQVINPIQMIVGFITQMYDSFNIGTKMIGISFNMLGFQVPQFIKTAIYSVITISVMFAIVALIWKWRG